jgi:hypothetical protein
MKPFQFETCKNVDEKWVPTGKVTPIVYTNTPTEAMNHPDIQSYFAKTENAGQRIYRQVN